MTKILFLDLDGTVRETKSGATFINKPDDQKLIEGVQETISNYDGWRIIGITNQGGVATGFKSLKSCLLEQAQTLQLLPRMERIYFCPDNGETCYEVTPSIDSPCDYMIYNHEFVNTFSPSPIPLFRKPVER